MRVRMLMLMWRGHSCPRTLAMRMVVSMGLLMFMCVMLVVSMRMSGFLFRPVLLSGQILFTVNPDVNFRGRDPAAHHSRDFQLRAYPERRHRLLQQLRRDPGIHQHTQKHVAADTGKALYVGNPHE